MNTIMTHRILKRALLFLALIPRPGSFAADTESTEVEQGAIEIEVDSQIEPYRGGHFKSLLELGRLPVNRQIKINAEIQNPYDRKFEFDFIRPGCKCVHASASSSTIEPNGHISLEFVLEVPTKVEGLLQTVGITFGKHGEPTTSLLVVLSYEPEGVLSFSTKMVTVKGSPDVKYVVWRVPFLMTQPCKLENVESRGMGVYENKLVTNIVEDEGRYFVQCELPTEGLTTGGLAGEVEIRDPLMQRSDTILCVAQLEPELEMAPSTMHLRYDQEANVFTGSYLLRFRKGVLQGTEKLAEGPPVSVKCWLTAEKGTKPDISIVCKAKRLADNVYRVQLTASSDSDFERSSSPHEVGIKTVTGTHSWESTAKIVFSSL